jgi:hypothetical protein
MTYANNKAHPRVGFFRDTRIPSEHEGADQYDGEDQDPDGSDVFDNGEGGDLLIVQVRRIGLRRVYVDISHD